MRVLREFRCPDGSLAARETVLYEAGRLISCELAELRTGARASVVTRSDQKTVKAAFAYTKSKDAKTKTNTEFLENLAEDM